MSAEIAGMSDGRRSKRLRNWERELISRLPVFGHRNWIVIADSAFPAQSNPGICTVVSDSDQPLVVARVLDLVAKSKHLKATIYLDQELGFVQERDARGISTYRRQLGALLRSFKPIDLLHDDLIRRLDKASRVFSILVIKTTMDLPYTTVFFELDCGYWPPAAEDRLRSSMENAKPAARQG